MVQARFKMKYNFLATLLLAVLLLELILKVSPLLGAIIYLIAIAAAVIAASRLDYLHERKKQIILLVAAVCAIKITSLFLPLNLFFRTLVAYALLTFVSVFYASNINVSKRKIKYRWVGGIAVAAVLWGYAGNIVAGFEKNILFLALIPLIAFSEEYIFRGLLLNSAEREHGKETAVVFTALFYGILCLGYGLAPAFFFFTMSLLFGLAYIYTRRLFLTMILSVIVHAFLFAAPSIL